MNPGTTLSGSFVLLTIIGMSKWKAMPCNTNGAVLLRSGIWGGCESTSHMVILVKLRVGADKSVFNGRLLENCEDGEISFLFGSALASSDQRDE